MTKPKPQALAWKLEINQMKNSTIIIAARQLAAAVKSTLPAALLMLCTAAAPLAGHCGEGTREPELPDNCGDVAAPAGNKVIFHAYAAGYQVYQWNGIAWVFVAPSATLYANADYDGEVGTHYAGPTWESNSGSKVVARRVAGCTPDATAIPWLRLQATSATGPGVFSRVTFVQRVNTVGGLAPAEAGSFNGEVREVFYAAEYIFYRASND